MLDFLFALSGSKALVELYIPVGQTPRDSGQKLATGRP